MRTSAALERLCDELRLTLHRVVQVSEAIHASEPVTLGMRAVLEYLQRNGPATVPEIARRRHVTRQHIQGLVNALLERGLVVRLENPAHRRSPRVAPSPQGQRCFRRMQARERRAFVAMGIGVADAELDAAAAVLRAVRADLREPAG